jgi:phenol 2-monooxygenase
VQFHENGFQVGSPDIRPADPSSGTRSQELPDAVDVLIVGCGPAGLVLAAQLAAFPHISTRIVERKNGPLDIGQADGISCRSVEMFDAFGFSERLVNEAYWVNETVFWRPDDSERSNIVRTGRVQDVEDGLSEFPHLIVNQARIHDYLLENMRNSPSRLEPNYGLVAVGVDIAESGDYPVTVTMHRTDSAREGEAVTIRARYVVGADGARSSIRQAMGGELRGDSANHVWGVLDILAVTDFPDIRLKAAIQSGNGGNILLIPREGGYLVRLYVDLGEVDSVQTTLLRRQSAFCTRIRSRSKTSPGSRSTRWPSASLTSLMTFPSSKWTRAHLAYLLPAMPVTPTAPKPVRV